MHRGVQRAIRPQVPSSASNKFVMQRQISITCKVLLYAIDNMTFWRIASSNLATCRLYRGIMESEGETVCGIYPVCVHVQNAVQLLPRFHMAWMSWSKRYDALMCPTSLNVSVLLCIFCWASLHSSKCVLLRRQFSAVFSGNLANHGWPGLSLRRLHLSFFR